MRVMFMGTPDFAGEILEAIINAGHEVPLVVTQPDKPKGRSGALCPSPVKEIAVKNDIPVFQPVKIRLPENVAKVVDTPCDVCVVAAFGQILPKEILEFPKYGCINVHASLLPKYRGAAPIQWAILNGEEKTGVTIMQMGEGLDDGDILYTKELPIREDHTGGLLFDELAKLGADTLVEALDKIDELKPVPQDEALATKVGKISKELGRIDFNKSAEEIVRYIKGLNPWPSAFTDFNGKLLKLWWGRVAEFEECQELKDKENGAVAKIKDKLYFRASDKLIEITELQLEGKKRMNAADFCRGINL
ncbi:MAG: methionyl-tRNA formyltransferase [Lachnospiraceae bacterium]|nr:methionyl-tRNA formyltransferase [Lachnospiraceae bacterium]